MAYIYIHVNFETPTEADFAAFQNALDDTARTQRHVHCIYNARVSAFFHRLDKSAASFALMEGIWRPGGVWAGFIGKDTDISLPNRYRGEDY